MEDFLYMGMKNDVSFLIDWNLNLFEHQSTYNPNMPLRGFMYMAASFKKYVELNRLDLYSSKLIRIPVPRYFVFYNGKRPLEDEVLLRLTDQMEVTDMLLKEYDEAFHIASEKEISFEEGRQMERANTEKERQRAEAEKNRAEKEKNKAQEEKKRADKEKQRADEMDVKIKILTSRLRGETVDEIVKNLGVNADQVEKVLENI